MNKRLIICCDGTWNTPKDEHSTNVITTARSILPEGTNIATNSSIKQIVFYDWGVGTGDILDKIEGGAMGEGLDKNIQDAYRFIVHNYEKNDELFLFGFSRGAYTIRSLGGLIRNCGILKRTNANLIPRAYSMYRSKAGPDCNTATDFRNEYSHHKDSLGERVSITFMGVWDTVGALGIPIRFLKFLTDKKYDFHDAELSSITKNAYHAVAIDEKRGDFIPVLWSNMPKLGQVVEQIWFPGVHSDIGGGYEEKGLANEALHWMLNKAKVLGFSFDQPYLNSFTPNSLDILHRSRKNIYKFKSRAERHIVQYNAATPEKSLHSSVKTRYQGMDYKPENLEEYLESNNINW